MQMWIVFCFPTTGFSFLYLICVYEVQCLRTNEPSLPASEYINYMNQLTQTFPHRTNSKKMLSFLLTHNN